MVCIVIPKIKYRHCVNILIPRNVILNAVKYLKARSSVTQDDNNYVKMITMNEFDIIKHYFATQTAHRADILLGIGDDAAIVQVPAQQQLVVTTDTLIAGVHFPTNTSAYDIGYKALAVNLSDLAAMGATPSWFCLALTIADADDHWLTHFCEGMFTLANRDEVALIGGDLTRGPLSITVQAMGVVPPKMALLRSGARPGELIYVTGTLGDAGLALRALQTEFNISAAHLPYLHARLNRPEPRVQIGMALRGLASSAIDISDGLVADLQHILDQSQVGAKVNIEKLPLSAALKESVNANVAIELALTAGDDYELCFTVPKAQQALLEKKLAAQACAFTCIGEITTEPGLKLYQHAQPYVTDKSGYAHF
jgi:thiamine-monophosphate kinase